MLRALLAILLLLAAQPSAAREAAAAPGGIYDLEASRASLRIRIPVMGGLSRYTVRFGRLSGQLAYDPAQPRATRATIVVDPRSLDAGQGPFSGTVAAAFELEKHPLIRFVSTRVETEGEGASRLVGDLTFHGVTRPVTLDVRLEGARAGRLAFTGGARIRRSDFGVTAARPFAGDLVDLVFDVEFVQKRP
jgi:polyisoprenoid-binding protein YceI